MFLVWKAVIWAKRRVRNEECGERGNAESDATAEIDLVGALTADCPKPYWPFDPQSTHARR